MKITPKMQENASINNSQDRGSSGLPMRVCILDLRSQLIKSTDIPFTQQAWKVVIGGKTLVSVWAEHNFHSESGWFI